MTIDVRDRQRMPSLSLVICIDKSGSMTAGQFGTTRIEVAKEAAAVSASDKTVKQQPVRKAKKVGPNDPCPCGSGKKYKKCCRDKDIAEGRA